MSCPFADNAILRDPANKEGTMPIKLPASLEHTRNFIDSIKAGTQAICDIETAVRSDTLCQLAAIARPPHTPSPLHVRGQLDPTYSKAISYQKFVLAEAFASTEP
jgi:hypothetical protein